MTRPRSPALHMTLLGLALTLTLTACPGTPAPAPDTTPPTVSLSAAPSSVTSAGTVSLNATASDNVGVTRVEFYAGGTRLGSDPSAPYTWSDPLTAAQNGTRSYTARAFDAAGNEGSSSPQSVTVSIGGGGNSGVWDSSTWDGATFQ